MTIGFRVLARRRKVDADSVAKFRALPVADVSDVMSRMTAGGPRLRRIQSGASSSARARHAFVTRRTARLASLMDPIPRACSRPRRSAATRDPRAATSARSTRDV